MDIVRMSEVTFKIAPGDLFECSFITYTTGNGFFLSPYEYYDTTSCTYSSELYLPQKMEKILGDCSCRYKVCFRLRAKGYKIYDPLYYIRNSGNLAFTSGMLSKKRRETVLIINISAPKVLEAVRMGLGNPFNPALFKFDILYRLLKHKIQHETSM